MLPPFENLDVHPFILQFGILIQTSLRIMDDINGF